MLVPSSDPPTPTGKPRVRPAQPGVLGLPTCCIQHTARCVEHPVFCIPTINSHGCMPVSTRCAAAACSLPGSGQHAACQSDQVGGPPGVGCSTACRARCWRHGLRHLDHPAAGRGHPGPSRDGRGSLGVPRPGLAAPAPPPPPAYEPVSPGRVTRQVCGARPATGYAPPARHRSSDTCHVPHPRRMACPSR